MCALCVYVFMGIATPTLTIMAVSVGCYTDYGSFDSHNSRRSQHAKLLPPFTVQKIALFKPLLSVVRRPSLCACFSTGCQVSIPVSFKNQLTLIAANAPRCSAAFYYGCHRRQGERERVRRGLAHCLCARLIWYVSFVVSLLPQLRWLIALMTCNIEHDSGQTVGAGECHNASSPFRLLLLLVQVALCQCQMLILIMPTDLTSGHRIQSITLKYVHIQKSHENRISRVKFEEKQIRVHKKHEKDRKRVENSARKPS